MYGGAAVNVFVMCDGCLWPQQGLCLVVALLLLGVTRVLAWGTHCACTMVQFACMMGIAGASDGAQEDELSFLGPMITPDIACGVAAGRQQFAMDWSHDAPHKYLDVHTAQSLLQVDTVSFPPSVLCSTDHLFE